MSNNYTDFFKSKKSTAKDILSLIPEGVDPNEFKKGMEIEKKHVNDDFLAAKMASKNLREDAHHYSKIYETQVEECATCGCGDPTDDHTNEELGDEYEDNNGLPKLGGALAVPHLGQPIMMGKIITVGNKGNGLPASGELSGMTKAGGVAKDTGGLPVNQQGDKEPITAGGKNTDNSVASKSVGGPVVPGEGQRQGGPNSQGTIANTSKLDESKKKVKEIVKEVLKEIRFDKQSGKWVKINENTVDMKMGPSYKKVQPRMYQTSEDDWARKNEYDPEITEMYDEEEECMMNERYVELANAKRNLSESEITEMKNLREKIDRIAEKKKKTDKWIQKAVNPSHKGYCTPMSKPTCTPRRKALAMRFKKGDLSEDDYSMNELNAADVIGYAYDADIHCLQCAEQRFGDKLNDENTKDSEGNSIHPVFGGDENANDEHCGDCGEKLISEIINVDENTVDMKMGPSYKKVQPRMYKTAEDDFSRTNEYDPDINENEDLEEAGGGAVQHSSYRDISHGNLPQNGKTRWANDVDESAKQSKVSRTIKKGMKPKSSTFKQKLKHQTPKKTSSGVHKKKL